MEPQAVVLLQPSYQMALLAPKVPAQLVYVARAVPPHPAPSQVIAATTGHVWVANVPAALAGTDLHAPILQVSPCGLFKHAR